MTRYHPPLAAESPLAALPAFAMEVLLPLCRDRFADPRHGGFFEQLGAGHDPLPLGTKRLMVQCRQLYVLSHAAVLGDASGAAAAGRGYDFLRRAYHDTVHGGWFFRATDDGMPADRRKDLYGHAFVLFALAWLHRAFAAPDAQALAAETLEVLHRRLRAPGGGFWDAATEDWTPEHALLRQNPHMHLLEAVLAWHEATGATEWLAAAADLVELFAERFYDAPTATLGEFFDAGWRPHPAHGHIVEPGHHFEWVWLLHRWQAQSGRRDPEGTAEALYATAMRYGFDAEHGGIHDQIDRAGRPLATTRRIWPVAEAIKAQVARLEAGAPIPSEQPERLVRHLFADFLRPAELRWIETTTREGTPRQTTLPGSTPYHIFLAAAELARVLGSRPSTAAGVREGRSPAGPG
jgi:mannose/cellobiose epimerase-like protein (N-acyl-D-glucosamine 2-epimerase family)